MQGRDWNLTGKTFGRLLVDSTLEDKLIGDTRWLCYCDCGNFKYIKASNLYHGITRSCGCLQKEIVATTKPGTKHGLSYTPMYKLWKGIQSRAKQRELECDIELDDLVVPEYCPVLGMKLEHSSELSPNSPSVDRMDNSRGYTKDNVQVISRRANVLKNDATIEEMEAVLAYMKRSIKLKDNNI